MAAETLITRESDPESCQMQLEHRRLASLFEAVPDTMVRTGRDIGEAVRYQRSLGGQTICSRALTSGKAVTARQTSQANATWNNAAKRRHDSNQAGPRPWACRS